MRLALRFVESESTARELQRELQRDMLVDCQAVLRPLRQLGTVVAESAALKKPGTRRKVRKLERQGVVAFETVRDATVLTETLALLVDWYDLRIAALGGGKPFREDPRKAAWFADAINASPSMHVTRLMVGADPVAMHIGVRSADRVALGVLAYDARQAESSPAALLLHHLFAALSDSGVTSFDLTPHGAYKDRFANAQDSVLVLDAIVKPRVLTRLAKLARRQLSATARAHPQVSARVRSGVERIRTHGVLESLRHLARQVRTEDQCLVFEHPLVAPTPATGILTDPRELLRRWLTLDLPAGIQPRGAPSMRSILLAFERGNLPLGVVEQGLLVAWGWIGRRESQAEWYWPVVPVTHPRRVVLCDEFITSGVDYRTASLQLHAARLRLPTTDAPPTHAFLVVAAGDGPAVDAAIAADFTMLGMAERRVRWGRTTTAWRWTR
ncbi:MAG: GNAT family N-acetyltransferase [Gemmatimonadaceae bacterium]|nr:GNAT family N-acetyltransferase [Gemmatimonadaceae bacterium]